MRGGWFVGMLLLAQLSHADDVIYQSAPYAAGVASGSAVCSSAACLDPLQWSDTAQYIGESFSMTSAATIHSIDFHKGLFFVDPETAPMDIPADITIAFYDAAHTLVYAQVFSPTAYTQTLIQPGLSPIYNVHATFTPFSLAAGDYVVYYFGDHLGIATYAGYGDTLVVVAPSQGLGFDHPYFAFDATALKLSGHLNAVVPEPVSRAMLLTGLALVYGWRSQYLRMSDEMAFS